MRSKTTYYSLVPTIIVKSLIHTQCTRRTMHNRLLLVVRVHYQGTTLGVCMAQLLLTAQWGHDKPSIVRLPNTSVAINKSGSKRSTRNVNPVQLLFPLCSCTDSSAFIDLILTTVIFFFSWQKIVVSGHSCDARTFSTFSSAIDSFRANFMTKQAVSKQ